MSSEKDIRRIACITMESIPRDVQANAEKTARHMQRAAEADADLAVFPEMSLVGYVDDARSAAVKSDSPVLLELAERAGKLGIAASVGYFEDAGEKNYVAQAFLHEGKIKSVYRKIYSCEPGAADGRAFETVDWNGAKIATIICKDLHFPAVAREHAKRGALVILQPSAYREDPAEPFDDANHNVYLPRARARENGVFFFLVNAAGCPKDGKMHFGNAIAVGPCGKVLGRIDRCPYSENMMVVKIDLNEARNCPGRENVMEELGRCGLLDTMPAGKQGT